MNDTTKRVDVDRFHCPYGLQEHQEGDYVRHSDYAALLLRASDLTADRDSWRRLAESLEAEKMDAQAKLAELEAALREIESTIENTALAMTELRKRAEASERDRDDARSEVDRLTAIINTPQGDDFLRAVSIEAEHQRQRWGSKHDVGKTAADWFWLIGYLAGKALHSAMHNDATKAEHHIITTAAACANWHKAMNGGTNMRPGIDGAAFLAANGG